MACIPTNLGYIKIEKVSQLWKLHIAESNVGTEFQTNKCPSISVETPGPLIHPLLCAQYV